MNIILVMVEMFSKMAHFIAYRKTMNDSYIVHLYFKKVVYLLRIPRFVTSYHDTKFMNSIWKSLWGKLGTQLNFNSVLIILKPIDK
jgi:hypothetical protein